MALNRVTLIGNVGKRPETRTFENGSRVTSFTLATTERYTDRDGERRELTEWHNVTAFGRLAETAEKYVDKGQLVYVEGKLRTRTWETGDGERRQTTEIVCSALQLLGKPRGERGPEDDMPE